MTSRRQRQTWAVEHTQDDVWNLTLGNRPVLSGIASRELTLRQLSARHRPGDRVVEIEPDGYRTDITRNLIRSQVITAVGQRAKPPRLFNR